MSVEGSRPTLESKTEQEEQRGNGAPGWFGSLKSKLGLPGGQTLRDTLEYLLREDGGSGEESLSTEEREMFLRLLTFNASRVEDVMVPRADIIAVEENESIGSLIATFENAGVSRVPVFNETLDDPRGMIHIKDLFRWLMAEANASSKKQTKKSSDPKSTGAPTVVALNALDLSRPVSVVTKIRRPVLFVPPSMPAMNLLIRMQSTRRHMALVVDEYGGTDGLITIEDLVEQIVGAIEDEHDEAEAAHIVQDPKLGLVASARTPVSVLEEHIGAKFMTPEEEEDVDTLGGLVFTIVGRVPARGEIVRHSSGLEFEVLDADARRVKKLKIYYKKQQPEEVARARAPADGPRTDQKRSAKSD